MKNITCLMKHTAFVMKHIALFMKHIAFFITNILFLRIDPGFSLTVAKATTIHKMEPPKGGRRPKAAPILCVAAAFTKL